MSQARVQPASQQEYLVTKGELATALLEARAQTRRLLAPLDTRDLEAQHSELMSPLVWDLAHIGWYEEYWLLRELGAKTPDRSSFDEIYDAFDNPRSERPNLPSLDPAAAWSYCDDVRGRALEWLDRLELDSGDPLLARGFVYGLVAQHELQHGETMLQTLQLRPAPYPPAQSQTALRSNRDCSREPSEVSFPGGTVTVGSDHHWAYDNEKPVNVVELAPFAIDVWPVSNRQYQAFIDDGGYANKRLWDPTGWDYIRAEGIGAPLGWAREDDAPWSRRRLGLTEAVPDDEPVQHVSWFEADAYARWAGKRLPSEPEWEVAATWDPAEGRATVYPWGDAYEGGRSNVGCVAIGPAECGAFAEGASHLGCEQMVGDVWEWTSSDFGGYEGFEAFPYPEYSEVFFGAEYKVLRGGSWATSPQVARTSFRNWDFPIRRQLFVGFRCARDA